MQACHTCPTPWLLKLQKPQTLLFSFGMACDYHQVKLNWFTVAIYYTVLPFANSLLLLYQYYWLIAPVYWTGWNNHKSLLFECIYRINDWVLMSICYFIAIYLLRFITRYVIILYFSSNGNIINTLYYKLH